MRISGRSNGSSAFEYLLKIPQRVRFEPGHLQGLFSQGKTMVRIINDDSSSPRINAPYRSHITGYMPSSKLTIIQALHFDDVLELFGCRPRLVVVVDDIDAFRPPIESPFFQLNMALLRKSSATVGSRVSPAMLGLRPALLAKRLW